MKKVLLFTVVALVLASPSLLAFELPRKVVADKYNKLRKKSRQLQSKFTAKFNSRTVPKSKKELAQSRELSRKIGHLEEQIALLRKALGKRDKKGRWRHWTPLPKELVPLFMPELKRELARQKKRANNLAEKKKKVARYLRSLRRQHSWAKEFITQAQKILRQRDKEKRSEKGKKKDKKEKKKSKDKKKKDSTQARK